MTWFLSYVGANFALVLVVVLAVLALAAVAWFAKNWKIAAVALIVAAAGLAAQQFDKGGYDRRVAEEAAARTAVLQGRLDTLAKVAEAYAVRASEDTATIDALRVKASQTPANTAPGLPEAAAKRVGDIR